jgi:hypothetical protein
MYVIVDRNRYDNERQSVVQATSDIDDLHDDDHQYHSCRINVRLLFAAAVLGVSTGFLSERDATGSWNVRKVGMCTIRQAGLGDSGKSWPVWPVHGGTVCLFGPVIWSLMLVAKSPSLADTRVPSHLLGGAGSRRSFSFTHFAVTHFNLGTDADGEKMANRNYVSGTRLEFETPGTNDLQQVYLRKVVGAGSISELGGDGDMVENLRGETVLYSQLQTREVLKLIKPADIVGVRQRSEPFSEQSRRLAAHAAAQGVIGHYGVVAASMTIAHCTCRPLRTARD